MPETTVPVSLRDAFLEDPFFRTGWDEMNSECREMRSFAEGNNTLATMDRSWPLLPKQWMLPQLFQDFHLPEMKDSLMLGLQEEKDKMEVTLESTRDDFFKQARQSFEESLKQMESRMSNALTLNTQGSNDSLFPKDWMMKPPAPLTDNFGSMLDRKQDCSTIKHNEDDNKVEVHLDTSGYKPDELKVQVEGNTVRVEGKHEERSQAGAVMVSRQFVKEYALPEGSKPEGVESSLSKDGVLVITMPKPRKAINTDKSRSVPIAIK